MDQNLYGPPGSGKTRRLTAIARGVVREHGPDRLGAITFTRAASKELSTRLAQDFFRLPLVNGKPERLFPYVGTIHSLCWFLIGRPKVITGAQKREWASAAGFRGVLSFGGVDNPDYADALNLYERDENAPYPVQALHAYSAARQRCLDPLDGASNQTRRLLASYEDYKRQNHVIDFEDMLELGMREPLPVHDLLVDEAQDNSKLLWSVIDAWRRRIPRTVCAGDPWQALYHFSGGDPSLFRSQPGDWETIDDSHRLDQPSAEYALAALREGGQNDPLLASWKGIGGQGRDGSEFYLARTGRLVDQIEDDLLLSGVPFGYLSGKKSLIGADATLAYRAGRELHETGSCQAYQLATFVKALRKGILHPQEIKRIEALARADPETRVYASDLYWADHIQRLATHGLPNADYYHAVVLRHGPAALVLPPKVQIGTVHSAKGREADTVHLATCWASLPGRAAMVRDVSEVCVAYVGLSRHRQTLHMLHVDRPYGLEYPWPARYAVVNT